MRNDGFLYGDDSGGGEDDDDDVDDNCEKNTFLVKLPGNRRGCLSQSKQTTGVPAWLHHDDEEDGNIGDECVL